MHIRRMVIARQFPTCARAADGDRSNAWILFHFRDTTAGRSAICARTREDEPEIASGLEHVSELQAVSVLHQLAQPVLPQIQAR